MTLNIRKSRSQIGMSLMEVTIVLAITTAVLLIAYDMMDAAVRTSLFVESHNDLPVMGQQVANRIQTEVIQSRAFFDTSAENTYLKALERPDGTKLNTLDAPESILPVADTSQLAILPDVSTKFVGNSLLIARQLEPILVDFDHDGDSSTAPVQYPADRYEFQYYFLVRDPDRNFSGLGYYLDLMLGQSEHFADYFQLSSLEPSERADLHPKLKAAGIDLDKAWDPGAPSYADAFYSIQSDGSFSSLGINHVIEVPNLTSLLPSMAGGRISGYMDYSVATLQPDGKPFPLRHQVGAYSIVNPLKPEYPSGFEVKFVGPAGYRKAFVRILLMAHYSVDRYDSAESYVTTSVRF